MIDWNYKGRYLLAPHYQKLVTIRGQFPAFTQHKRDTNIDGQVTSADSSDFLRAPSSNGLVYAFTRPYPDQNGLTAVNFSASEQTARLDLTGVLNFTGGIQPNTLYYLNNLYANVYEQVFGSALDSVSVTLPPYGSGIYTVSMTHDSVYIESPITDVRTDEELPLKFELAQNYPNPFNPTTTIQYALSSAQFVKITVFDVLGRELATLVNDVKSSGRYTATWDATGLPSGVYFYRMVTPSFTSFKKMLLVR